MKTFIALGCALFVAQVVLADPYSAAMRQARNVAAKSSAAANQTDDTPSPAPPSQSPAAPSQNVPPPNPALQATMENIAGLRADLAALGGAPDTNLTTAQKLPLLNDLAAAAQGTKPTQKSLSQLGDDLAAAIAGKEKLRAPQPRLAQYVHAAFNGAHLTAAQEKMIFDDVQKILNTGGVSPEDATNVVNDLKTIAAETK
jgi:hypothetical protein